ncbi:hypothetical protein PTSG_01421 [Salpingoeca rosetta]|uniref:Stress-associated endoplasmic reticulum protein n=1 Tax=Salpingoeca rosetta (strain ATCC 50818 / BSB-021) TaxID=946362 RepID=F2U0A7_SALR5|nr:uncharacterized protein PTSG_01421 [Salpingoeca rosetta]EGD80835.1 hypothetical protein PTSG_01421 [Salpingoeca rosetta]|eukprot:XP_004997396.1 hypothetical protein PTSG_01421 [Salpingoeca rosetta]
MPSVKTPAMRRSSERHANNITRKGNVPASRKQKKSEFPVGPVVLGLLIFVVCGSAIFQLLQSVQFGGPPA